MTAKSIICVCDQMTLWCGNLIHVQCGWSPLAVHQASREVRGQRCSACVCQCSHAALRLSARSALASAGVSDKPTTDSHPFFLKRCFCELSLTIAEPSQMCQNWLKPLHRLAPGEKLHLMLLKSSPASCTLLYFCTMNLSK